MLKRFLRNASGATAIEYSLIALLVSAAAIGGITAVGEASKAQIDSVADAYPKN